MLRVKDMIAHLQKMNPESLLAEGIYYYDDFEGWQNVNSLSDLYYEEDGVCYFGSPYASTKYRTLTKE